MKIDCISDLHGHYPPLAGGDLLIVAGDLTASDTPKQFQDFFDWLSIQDYEKAIVIGGNHDNLLQKGCISFLELDKPLDISITYLCDGGTKFEGLKIWGSPWSLTFRNMNPHCKAFTVDTEDELYEKWALIPDDVDILITHSPAYGILDAVERWHGTSRNLGSVSLAARIGEIRPKLHVFGHIHEGYGHYRPNLGFVDCRGYPIFVNASYVNERYEPVNKPIRIEL